MGERTGYEPGTFCWVDLSTPDPTGSKEFYTALFGWDADDVPLDDAGLVYSLMKVGGSTVAGIGPQNENQRSAGVPPLWSSYIWVEDADAVAARARELGAKLQTPPFDVFGAGRTAVLEDPQGAAVMLWQPKENRGAQLVNAPGAFCWNELYTPDIEASARFYGALFGWTTAPFESSSLPYLVISNDGRSNGGITQVQEGMPPAWLAYFVVEDIDAGLARVSELGGTTIAGPIDINVAKLAIVQDPQGAVFALYAGTLEE